METRGQKFTLPILGAWAMGLMMVGGGCATTSGAGGAQDAIHLNDEIQKGFLAVEDKKDGPTETIILQGATVMTAAGTIFESGHVVLADGKILAVGEGDYVGPGTVMDVSGQFVTPGVIDVHSHLGVYPSPSAKAHSDGNEATGPVTAGVWSEHSFWPQDPGIERAVAGGVTTIQVLPGSANLVGGRGVVLHMTPRLGPRAMRFEGAPETVKMACGENPKRVYGHKGRMPSTRMGNVKSLRTAFLDAKAYGEKWEAYEKAPKGKAPDRDLTKETLWGVMQGEILPQIHCYRADDMLSMLQIAEEFGFEIRTFHHALEAYKIRDILAEKHVASATWADWWGFKMEAYDGIPYNAALLADAGAPVVIHSDSAIDIQRLNQEAAKAYYKGLEAGIELTEDQALGWITKDAAEAIGIGERVGTLEVGKIADVVVWSKHPFSIYSQANYVFIDGHLEYDAQNNASPWSDFLVGQGEGL